MQRIKACASVSDSDFNGLLGGRNFPSGRCIWPVRSLSCGTRRVSRAGGGLRSLSHKARRRALRRRLRRSNSPFGPLYPPNITPDPVHGIGAWSDDDFYRAMHNGVGRHGQYLYPAFPYQWFTKVTRDDVLAIRAFLKTVAPSSEPSKPNRLMFPFDIRAGLGPWQALYFHPGEYKPDPGKSAEWNRGAYLVEGLGHCADCHTPKGLAMEPINSKAFSGGSIDNWYAPNITSDPAQGIGRWSEGELVQYFKTGTARGKGVVVGPMAQVVHDSLSHLSDSDLQAIAAYLKSIPPLASYKADRPTDELGPNPAVRRSMFNIAASAISWTDGAGRERCRRSRVTARSRQKGRRTLSA